tara:strand:+ start:813 stop:1082 length:270 start_codon:yes stop_codon:yes gene_type:complete
MGSNYAYELADNSDLDTGLEMHLRANHYPPVPIEMVAVCKEAIDLMNEGLPNSQIELPLGTRYRGDVTAPAWAIADAHHLGAWIAEGEL